ncbi:MAG: S8 family peptidase [Calothrix sp. C42_A2020_038]|nr:S8 family peptidase [Calothrix sp. C42_A2020_038]
MDPALWELLGEGESQDEVAAIIRLEKHGILPEGVRIISQFGDIATCRLQRNSILEVRAEAAVASFKAPRLLVPEPVENYEGYPENKHSLSWVDERRPLHEEATGCGVVIGVVDWGFDFAHPEFRNTDGSTRILALWNQQTRGGQPPHPYGYGVVYTQEAINHALKTANPYTTLNYHPGDVDPKGEGTHGTHVASIAAGNGRGGGPVGVAPEADLVFVHMGNLDSQKKTNLGNSVSLLEAIDFIAKTAGNRPWVVNLSMGRHGEQHDGTTLVEQGLDEIVNATTNRAIVQSVGNYFDRCIHTQGIIRPGEVRSFIWQVDAGDITPNQLEVWYSGRDFLIVELKAPNGLALLRVKLGERKAINIQGCIVGNIYHRAKEPNNLDNHIDIFLYAVAPAGNWEVKLIAQDIVDGRFHAWIERDVALPNCQSRFAIQDSVENCTTGTICNGYRTIAVGAYNAHSSEREIASFSSAGPTRDGRTKPDLVAPGVLVLAARSTPRHTHSQILHTRKSGTSMAAPHVAGTVALMFEVARQPLKIEDTRNLLLGTTQKAIEEKLFRFGSGYLDIQKAVQAARQFGKPQTHLIGDFMNTDVISIDDATMDTLYSTEQLTEDLEWCGGYEADNEIESDQQEAINLDDTDVTDINDVIMDTLHTNKTRADELDWCGGYEADIEVGNEINLQLVDWAEEAIAAEDRISHPVNTINFILAKAGVAESVSLMKEGKIPSPATLFDAFTFYQDSPLQKHFALFFDIVVNPGESLAQPLQAGDILVRRALGEGNFGHIAVIADAQLRSQEELVTAGLQAESSSPGFYVQVVEGGAKPHCRQDRFARCLLDTNGRLSHDQLVLRLHF